MTLRLGDKLIADIAGEHSGGSNVVVDNVTIIKDENDTISAQAVLDSNSSTLQGIKTWIGTLAEYEAISPKSNETLYYITDDDGDFGEVKTETTTANAYYPILLNNGTNATLDNALINSSIKANPSRGEIIANAGKFGKQLTAFRYNANETPTTSFYWYKIFDPAIINAEISLFFDIICHGDYNYASFSRYTLSISNFQASTTNGTISINLCNHASSESGGSAVCVAIDDSGCVYIQSNVVWSSCLLINCIKGDMDIPYTNMGYSAFGEAIGFTSVASITNSGAIRYLKNSKTATTSKSRIISDLIGNADTSTKATQDSSGQQIDTTYIKNLSVSGQTLTITKGNGTTSTITTQDTNNKVQSVVSSSDTNCPILLNNGTSATTNTVLIDTGLYANPNTNTVGASVFSVASDKVKISYNSTGECLDFTFS